MSKLLVSPDAPRDPALPQFTMDGWIDTAPFEELLGMTIESDGVGEAVLSMPFTVKLAQGGGVMHGGALTTLADTAVAIAIKGLLPPGTAFATTSLSTRFLAPVTSGRVTARARVTGPEGRTFSGEAFLLNEDGREAGRFGGAGAGGAGFARRGGYPPAGAGAARVPPGRGAPRNPPARSGFRSTESSYAVTAPKGARAGRCAGANGGRDCRASVA